MNFLNNRTDALKKLDDFIEKNLLEYTKLRNFDFGIQNRKNISCLSPYVTHGVINEIEIINKVLKKHLFVKVKNLYKRFCGEYIGKDGLN